MTPKPHSRDYIKRTIETVRSHREAAISWPQWANIFADEIERLWSIEEQLEAAHKSGGWAAAEKAARRADELQEQLESGYMGGVSNPASESDVSERENATGAPPLGQSSEDVATGTRRPSRPAASRSETSDPASGQEKK